MSETLTIAVAQSPGSLQNPKARLDWLEDTLAAHDGPSLDLVVLPELFQCGYNIGHLIEERAEPSDGPFSVAISRIAQDRGPAILYGYAEKDTDGLYNSAQCIDKRGQVIGHHRKLLMPPGFEADHFAPGAGVELFQIGGFKAAILVCYDVEFPENLRHVAGMGAEVVLVPTALGAQWGVVSQCLVPTRAFENGLFVCYANHCGHENGLDYFGGSCIVAPNGQELARAGRAPGLMVSRLDRSAVSAAQERLPYHRDRLKLPWFDR